MRQIDGSRLHNVYIVTPDIVASTIIRRMLDVIQVRIHEYHTPSALLHKLPLESPACLLIDVLLPDMTGVELMRQLRARRCYAPVVFNAIRIEPDLIMRVMNLGAFGFLKRPFVQIDLIDMIQRALHQDQNIGPIIRQALDFQTHSNSLSQREHQILSLLKLGLSASNIGQQLNLSPRTVENHRLRIFRKLNIRSQFELAQKVAYLDLIRAYGTLD